MRNSFILKTIFALVLLMFAQQTVRAQMVAIKAGRLVDPENGVVLKDQTILVEGSKIKAIGPGLNIPEQAKIVDLSNSTVLPGMFDCHSHLCLDMGYYDGKGLRDVWSGLFLTTVGSTTGYRAILGAANARAMLASGFTTVRDVGNNGNYADTDLRRAIENGLVPGPTVINSGRIITPYGGQFPGLLRPDKRGLGKPEYIYADTQDELKKAIRENIQYGAKVIKLVVDDHPYIYSADDIRFAVDEAGKAGLRVAAHCMTNAGARNAALGGVASVEHGFEMTDETLMLLKKNNIVLVGTDFPELAKKQWGATDEEYADIFDRLKRAYKLNVTMAFGTDIFYSMPGYTRGSLSAAYLEVYKQAGIAPMDILKMLTTNATRLLGLEKERGAIKSGLAADIIAVPQNPLDDILALKKVTFVMKDGKVFKPGK